MLRGRVVGDDEPLFLDADTDWAIALHMEEAETHQCGHLITETFAPESDGAYIAETIRCHACAAVARESANLSKQASNESESIDLSGLFTTAKRRT